MEKPFAITLDVGSSLANKTGSWRTERPVYVHRLPPCADACPAGENVQQWLYDAEEGGAGYERAWRQIMEDNPFPAVMGRVCYHPCETVCNRGAAGRGRRDQLGRAVPRRRGDRAGVARRGHGAALRASASSSSAPGRPGSPPPTTSPASDTSVTVMDAGPEAGGMMRFGIPRYRLPRDVLDAEIQRIVELGVTIELDHKVTSILDDDAGGRLRRRVPRRRGAPRQARVHPGRLGGEGPRRGLAASQHGGRGAATARSPGRRLRRREHGDRRCPDGEAARRRGGDHRLPADARADAGPRVRGRGGGAGGRPDEVALHDQAGRRREARHRADGARRDRASRSRPASSRSSRPTRSSSRSARRPTSRCSTASRGSRSRTASSQVGPNMMSGYPGIFAGGDMVPAERTVTVAVGHGKKAARHIDAWLRGSEYAPSTEARARGLRPAEHLVLRRRAALRPAAARARPPAVDLRRGRRRPRRGDRALRGAALPVLRQLLLVRQLLRGLPGQRGDQARRARGAVRDRLDFCKGCGICAAECPCGAIEMVPEEI